MKVLVKRYNVYLALFLLILFNGIFTNNFLRMNTCWNIVIQCTTIMLVSLGMTVVIASGGIDISIGPIMALAAIVFARMLEYSALYAVLAALAVSVICGLLNGVIIAKFQIQPMIVTLGMMNMVRGSAELMNDGRTYSFHHPVFSELGYYRIGGEIPIQLLIIVIAIVLMYLLMKKMRFGAYVEAMGDNRKAARLAGVKVSGMLILIYILSGFLAGVAGLVEAMRMSAADPINFGLQIEVDAIAATAIGGTNMAGGKANLAGTVAGVFVMQIITVMVNMNNIPYSYSLVIKTIVVILAVCVQNGRISTLLPAKRKGAVS
ncbi:MAG: ABC transporter permease [Blautia sp.]